MTFHVENGTATRRAGSALRPMAAEHVISLGSFPKPFAPGFRVGWVVAPPAVREKLVLTQEAATLAPPVFSQYVISSYLEQFDWRGQIDVFRAMYRAGRDAMRTSSMTCGWLVGSPPERAMLSQ